MFIDVTIDTDKLSLSTLRALTSASKGDNVGLNATIRKREAEAREQWRTAFGSREGTEG